MSVRRPLTHAAYVSALSLATSVLGLRCGGNTVATGEQGSRTDATVSMPLAPCVPGQSVGCTGAGGCSSSQVCNASGSGYGACDCALKTDASVALCVPGRSSACTGPGGCSSNQVCNASGTAYGTCECASKPDASATPCVPGHSSACSGPGGCLSSQVCNASGTAYGSCECAQPTDASVVLCIPGESTACTGPGGCPSSQVCNASGTAYDACDCTPATPPAGLDGGTLPDGYAPIPASLGTQGYNAIWAADPNQVPEVTWIFRPLLSAPDCAVVPPFGETLVAAFKPTTAGPTGTFPACGENGPSPCYETERMTWDGAYNWETVPGGMLTLSAFNADGIATGMMNTTEGIVPLAVKKCP